MAIIPIPDADLYAALLPFRTEPEAFEAGVRTRIESAEAGHEYSLPVEDTPLLRIAAAFLPLPLITGGKVAVSAAKITPLVGKYKLLGYLALPAISLFVMVGSALFGAVQIRRAQRDQVPDSLDQEESIQAGQQWWSQHKWASWLFYAAVIMLPMFGSTWLLFLLLLVSMGVMLLMLTALAKQRLGNRITIGQSCLTGLLLLGQVMILPSIGQEGIHFLDQKLLGVIFFLGVLVLVRLIWNPLVAHRKMHKVVAWQAAVFLVALVLGMIFWFAKPTFFPFTRAQIKQHVESFDEAPYASATWGEWEKIATWSIRSGLDPDLSNARRLLAREIAGEQNPFILGSAFRVGLVEADQITQLNDFEKRYRSLLGGRRPSRMPRQITSLTQEDWVIRAAIIQGLLTIDQRDYLEKRLLATWEALVEGPSLEDALRVTELLVLLGRPLDRDLHRERVHGWLREFHCKQGAGFQVAGGFKTFLDPRIQVGDLASTWHAIELMKIYGIPDGLDMNWVRSFVKPMSMTRLGDRAYVAAVMRHDLEGLPGISQPTWLEYVVYERSMIMALLIVSLCLYAVLLSPSPGLLGEENEPN